MSKNRARDRAARRQMQGGARRARAARTVDTTADRTEYPPRLVDGRGESWYLTSRPNAYGTRALDYTETRTYEEIDAEHGPVRHVDIATEDDRARFTAALRQAGHRALGTLAVALRMTAEAAERATGRPGDLVAGRPGSWESATVMSLTRSEAAHAPAGQVDEDALKVLLPVLERWVVTGPTVVEVAESLTYDLAALADESGGWHGITDAWMRRHASESVRSWAMSRCSAPDDAVPEPEALPHTVDRVALVFGATLPVRPVEGLTAGSTVDELFAALVARAAYRLERAETGERYPARADVWVQPKPQFATPEDWPEGWRRGEALVMVTARRPWEAPEEDTAVVADMVRAAAEQLHEVLPPLPGHELAGHAGIPFEMHAALNGAIAPASFDRLLAEMQERAVHYGHTVMAETEFDPRQNLPSASSTGYVVDTAPSHGLVEVDHPQANPPGRGGVED
ncbi:hypothetical protein [Streptomyces nanshensis]|uniref:Uncharacterized protein n=1 Tax=Streptomyces nanshensis TaxID=518642 RepID=A0A1E7L9V0_9ACTN|nr:hypothetical protein [Streptomyces nanshensis]OEV12979.1 hypothetical protein AN218_05570 [Streptomyces nanshensis]